MLTEGTLVRIKETALTEGHEDGDDSIHNQRMVDEHGWLWRHEEIADNSYREQGDAMHYLKSLATGERAAWFRYEFETMEDVDGGA